MKARVVCNVRKPDQQNLLQSLDVILSLLCCSPFAEVFHFMRDKKCALCHWRVLNLRGHKDVNYSAGQLASNFSSDCLEQDRYFVLTTQLS